MEVLVAAGVVVLVVGLIAIALLRSKRKSQVSPAHDQSWSRNEKISLAGIIVGATVGVAGLMSSSNGGEPAEARYQRQVEATCKSVRGLSRRSPFGLPGSDGTFDRDTAVSGLRDSFTARNRRLTLRLDKPAPESLHDEAQVARTRADNFIRESRALLEEFADALPAHPTFDDIVAATGPLNDRFDAAIAPLEAAMTQLSGRDCSLTQT